MSCDVAALITDARRMAIHAADEQPFVGRMRSALTVFADLVENWDTSALAHHILAAGWRPPPQVITDPAELDALPPRSVVIDGCEDEILCRTQEGNWAEFGSDIMCTSAGVYLPATILYVPTEEARDGE